MRLLLLILIASSTAAQTVQVAAGGSTALSDSYGAQATLWTPNFTATSDFGYVDGKPSGSGSISFTRYGWDWTVGDSNITLSAVSAGVALPIQGIAASKKFGKQRVHLFSGATGEMFSAPFFSGYGGDHFGTGVEFDVKFHLINLTSIGTVNGSFKSALQSASLKYHPWYANASGGVLQNSKMGVGNVGLQYQCFSVSAAEDMVVYQGVRDSFQNVYAGGGSQYLTVSGGIFHSALATGETVSANGTLGWARAGISETFQSGQNATLVSFSQTIRRFHVSEYITQNQGHWSYSFGGGWSIRNHFSADVSQQIFWTILGFERTNAVTLWVSFRGLNTNASTVVTPGGIVKWTLNGDEYVQTGMQVSGGTTTVPITGTHFFKGKCVFDTGEPAEGCSVIVGHEEFFSRTDGTMSLRTRSTRSAKPTVNIDNFTAAGSSRWRIISVPDEITPDEDFKVVVNAGT